MTSPTALNDPFQVDELRARLARRGDRDGLRQTYAPGAYPELADLSSAQLWDDLAGYTEAPDFRIRRLRAVAELVQPGSRVLDIGIGWGEIIPMILARGNCQYTGVDFSKEVVARVSEKVPGCRLLVGGLEQLNEQFDVILALEVLEHVLPRRIFQFYEHMKRLLASDGRLIVTVPVFENLRAMTLRCPNCGRMLNRVGHVRAYSPELIKAELALAGFNVLNSFFIYASFDHSAIGHVKRRIVDAGRWLLRLGRTQPLNIVVVARKTKAGAG